jgi:hypothetical protein
MRRPRSTRLLVAAALVGATTLTSGCVGFTKVVAPQTDVIGDLPMSLTVCASGSTGCPPTFSGVPAIPGDGQVLIGVRLPANASLPSSLTSSGPEALAFTDSPSYAAELQRLDPADPGTRWVGFISAVTTYSNMTGPQSFPVTLPYALGQGADGAPFPGHLETEIIVGGRGVTPASPGSRPVVCGTSLKTVFDEDPSPTNDVYAICEDRSIFTGTPVNDLGILAGASAAGSPGGLAIMGFTVRFAGPASPAGFSLTATTTLPGATLAVTPGDLIPGDDSTNQTLVAIGVPAGARAGTYDVTLTARLANGQTRTRTGKLTVLPAPAGPGGGTTGAGARLRLTTVLPRGLSVVAARRSGIAVLIGATKGGTARVQLFQGTGRKNRKPKASRGVRLRVPGPTRVVLKSTKLKKGAYRVVITAGGRTFVTRATLKK